MSLNTRASLLVLVSAAGLYACGAEKAPPKPAPAEPAKAVAESTAESASAERAIDPVSGLIIDDGWELVRGTCAACHSASLVTQNRGSRDTWESMIRWMQETQGLWPLDPATESIILDYLEKNYAPETSSRRMLLPPDLMPPNPYEPGA